MMIEVSYVGLYNTRQNGQGLSDINQVDPDYLSLGPLLTRSINSAEAQAAGLRAPYPGFNGSVAQALRAYPQYQRLTSIAAKLGESTYHGLETRISKRFSGGFSFQASYTYSGSHGLAPDRLGFGATVNGPQNAFDLDAERAVLINDIPHALVINYVYELPFGPGRKWLSAPGAASAILGGWTIAGIHRYQSGYPLPILMNNTLPIFNLGLRPDLVSGQSPSSGISNANFDPANDRIVNLAAFAAPAPFSFGSAPRAMDELRQFPVLTESLSISRRLPRIGPMTIEVQGQLMNAFNRVRFANFDPNFSSVNFGKARSTSLPRYLQLGVKVTF
jgi:hypothetical protein